MTNLQICIFSPYKEDAVEGIWETLRRLAGVEAVYVGQQVEHNDRGICVLQWHPDFRVGNDLVADLLYAIQQEVHLEYNATFKMASDGGGENDLDFARLFGVPAQEFTMVTLKKEEHRERWETLLQRMKLRLVMGAERAIGGVVHGIEGVSQYRYVIIAGWASYEAASLAKAIDGRGIVEDMLDIVEMDVKCAKKRMCGPRE